MNLLVQERKELYRRAAELFAEFANDAIDRSGHFVVALSGGTTPLPLYELLANGFRTAVHWEKAFIFTSDERCVPPDHPESNFGRIDEVLLSKLDIDVHNIHRMKGEIDPGTAAREYEKQIRELFNLQPREFPPFDLILLGMGEDGHTASIFPGSDVLNERHRLVAETYVPKLDSYRLTFTPPMLKHAVRIIVLVTGESKVEALRQVIEGNYQPDVYPAQILRNVEGEVIWMVDTEAAKLIGNDT